jgi:hypothetical protein
VSQSLSTLGRWVRPLTRNILTSPNTGIAAEQATSCVECVLPSLPSGKYRSGRSSHNSHLGIRPDVGEPLSAALPSCSYILLNSFVLGAGVA